MRLQSGTSCVEKNLPTENSIPDVTTQYSTEGSGDDNEISQVRDEDVTETAFDSTPTSTAKCTHKEVN